MAKSIKILFLVSIPVFLWGLLLILPTFDDWTYLTTPYFGDFFDNKGLLPYKSYWRPFDAVMGYILGLNYKMFPALNHILILLGHVGCTVLVYLLTKKNVIAATFFYLSTAMLGSVLDIDSANQVYSQFWGLLALWFYLKERKWLWVICFMTAIFVKENGIMFAFIPMIIKWGQEKRLAVSAQYVKDGLLALGFIACYGIARLLLTSQGNALNAEYIESGLLDHVKDLVQYSTTWIPMDMAALAYPPTRCLPLAIFTLLLAVPFLCAICSKMIQRRKDKMMYILVLSFFLAGAPHLVTLVSVMHSYAGLGMASLLIGYLFPAEDLKKKEAAMFGLFIIATLISDVHHWHEAYKSGLVGRDMAVRVLEQTSGKPQTVGMISVDNNETKYSNFNVIPRDAFGWGKAARFESGYTVANKEVTDTLIGPFDSPAAKELAVKEMTQELLSKNKYEAIWIIDGTDVRVVPVK